MLENIAGDKVKIFISSKCEAEKYTIVRQALKELLNSTGLVDVYIFEDGVASSLDVETVYIRELNSSDLCIFLIDNSEEVSEGVNKEYKRANELRKKTLYFFCDENNKKKSYIQEEIELAGKQMYKTVHKFSDIIKEVYTSVIQDIINLYKNKNYIDEENEGINTVEKIISNEYKIKKKNRLILTTNVLLKDITTVEKNNKNETDEIDFICSNFIRVILSRKKIDNEQFKILKDKILEEYDENLNGVIGKRLDIVKLYYSGNIEECIKKLKEILSIKNSDIPKWIMNDVAIDLRYMQNIAYEMQNKICYENDGQKYINDSEEALYYPLLDRIETQGEKNIVKALINSKIESPYTQTIENLEYTFDYISSCFYIALTNGSVTHLKLTLNRMCETLLSLNMRYDDYNIFIQTIKMLILERRDKDIKKLLRLYNKNIDIINSEDIEQICKNINNIEIDYYQDISECLLLKYFSLYFSASKYNEFFNKIYNKINIWLTCDSRILICGNYYFDMLKENTQRANNDDIANVVIKVFENELTKYYDNALEILMKLDYRDVKKVNQKNILNKLIKIMNQKEIKDRVYKLENTIIVFREKATIKEKNKLDEVVNKKMSLEFISIYKLEIEENKENKKGYIKKCIQTIQRQNEEQGKGGLYTGYSNDEYMTIKNIIKINDIILETKEIRDIMDVLLDTLMEEKQTVNAKNSAIQLMIFLRKEFGIKRMWTKYKDFILQNKEKFILSYGNMVFDGETISLMKLNLKLLYLTFGIESENEEINSMITAIQLKDYDKIKLLQYTNYFLEEIDYLKIKDRTIELLLQYVSIMSNEDDIDIRFWATKCLIQLTYSKYKTFVLQQLNNIMNSGNGDLKITIISRLNEMSLTGNDDFIKFILNKAKIDNNFLVRKIALYFNKNGGSNEDKK